VPSLGREDQGDGYFRPNGAGRWRRTNPIYPQPLIDNANTRLGAQLKPLIRVIKAWNLANGAHLHSFHLEMVVERMWRNATSLPSLPAAVAKSLETAPSWLVSAFSDPWDSDQSIDE